MSRLLRLTALVLLPLAAFLVLAEIGLRVYLEHRLFYDVEMSRYARTLKIDAENPKIGHLHRPNREARLMGVTVRINSDGFRDDELPRERNHRRRIVFLGDSLTFGWGVEQEETFAHLLESELDARRPTEILNFGTGNYNTVQEVSLFLEKGLAYRPDDVVLFYFINDAEAVPQKSRLPWLGSIRIVTFYWSRTKALWARLTPSAGFEEYYRALYRDDAPGWRAGREALLELARVCAREGIGLRVVLLPELHRLDAYTFAKEHALVAGFLREHDIPVLDLAPRFADQEDPQSLWVAPDDAHPNARAHRLIATHTLAFIAGEQGA